MELVEDFESKVNTPISKSVHKHLLAIEVKVIL